MTHFSELSYGWKKHFYDLCVQDALCTKRLLGGIANRLQEQAFFFICKDIQFDRVEDLSLYELMAKRPHEGQNFCAGYNEFPAFNNRTNTWFCACKDTQSQSGCLTSSSVNNTDSSIQIYIAILSIILFLMIVMVTWGVARYIHDVVRYRDDFMTKSKDIRENAIASLKSILYFCVNCVIRCFNCSFSSLCSWRAACMSAMASLAARSSFNSSCSSLEAHL